MLVRDFAGELATAGRGMAEDVWKTRADYFDPETAVKIGRLVFEDQARGHIAKAGVAADMVDVVLSSAMRGFDIRVRQLRKENPQWPD